MAEQPTLNTDLEQALYKATLREKKLRRRTVVTILVPLVIGGVWLFYSASEVDKWRTHSREIDRREASVARREAEARQQVAIIEAQLEKAKKQAQTLDEQEKTAKARADDIQQRLITVRDEIGTLGVVLTDLTSARAKASKMAASGAVESQIGDIRSSLARSLGRIEKQIDIALPPSEQKPRVYFFVADEQQRAAASQLKPQLENNGFDVAGITKTSNRRVESTEVRYFREPEDKAEATRLLAILEKQLGQTGCRINFEADPDHAAGAKKFHVWLSKGAASASR